MPSNVEEIKRGIRWIQFLAQDPNMDGFNTWGHKKKLYEIMWLCEEMIEGCSTYAGEEEFIEQHMIEKAHRILTK